MERHDDFCYGGFPMNSALPTIRARFAALNVPRLLAAMTLAIALLAIHGVAPDDAGAMRMREGVAIRACYNAGGTMDYDFETETLFLMTCTLPSGNMFFCAGEAYVDQWVDC